MVNYVIFTDLDGTLLHPETYQYKAVLPLFEQLKAKQIPVVLNSSKTLSELEKWHEALSLDTPLVGENGGVVQTLDPNKDPINHLIGVPYPRIRHVLETLGEFYGWAFEGFGDWSVGDVMNQTNLQVNEAVLAKERQTTEPIIWSDSDANFTQFKKEVTKHDLKIVKGGRFFHVMGHHDKSDAMRYLKESDPMGWGQDYQTIALGDSQNDLAMLQQADIAVVMPDIQGHYALEVAGAIYASQPGPEGWIESIAKIMPNL